MNHQLNMDSNARKDRSKFLSRVLRHQPALLHLEPDGQGWVKVAQLLKNLELYAPKYVLPLDLDILKEVVSTNDKQRFAFSPDFQKIRANQGHSIAVDLDYPQQEPPETLYHGTAYQNLESIFKAGIQKGKRHHVHLSPDGITAEKVGGRHGKPVILIVRAKEMSANGYKFYCSENGVWLTDEVPANYITRQL